MYASTCYFENTAVSVGRRTEYPFEVYGSPYLEGMEDFDFTFTPHSMSGAQEPPFMDEVCYGEGLREVPAEAIKASWQDDIAAFKAQRKPYLLCDE